MKKVLFFLLFAGVVASAAMAQTTPVQNAIVIGAHVLKPGVETTVPIYLLNPTDAAGVQIRLLYDPNVIQVVNPAGTDNDGTEAAGSVITGALGVVNYEDTATPDASGMKGIRLALAAIKGANKTGLLVTLRFKPKDGVAALSSSALSVDDGTTDANNKPLISTSATGGAGISPTIISGSLIVGGTGANGGWSTIIPQGISGSVSTDETNVWVVGNDGTLRSFSVTDGSATAGFTPFAVGASVLGRPVARDGAVYVAASNGSVSSVTPASGAKVWTTDLSAGAGGIAVNSTPAVANGKVYVTDGNDKLYALDSATGAVGPTQQVSTGAAANTQGFSSPAAFGPSTASTVWVGGADNALHQYAGADLTPQKVVATGGRVQSSPFISSGGIGFVGSEDGKVYVFNAGTGDILGNYDTTDPVQNSPFGVGANQAVVVNSSGELQVVDSGQGLSPAGSPSGSNPGSVKFTGGAGPSQSPIVLASGVWVGDINGVLHNVSITGSNAKNIKISSNPITSLAAPSASLITFSTTDGSVVAIPTGNGQ